VLCAGVELAERAQAADPDHLERLLSLAAAAEGWEYPELVGEFGDHHARAALAVVGAMYSDLRRAMGCDPHVGDFGDFLREAIPIAADVVPAAAAAIPGYGPVIAPVVKFGLEAAEREVRAGKAPKNIPPELKREVERHAQARAARGRDDVVERPRVNRNGEICFPAHWR
jgi:hypothetical protein